MKNLNSIEEFEGLKNGERVLFVFSADWCGDCRFLDPILPIIEEKYAQYEFIQIDRDEFIDLCVNMDIFGIPSFVAYEKGVELGRFVSKERKTQQEIEAFIDSL
ncbi:thioredoxin family protein [Lysinibacillus sp. 54212]|uniref:thioredoxin family protein n=1 Tax=Lysinibacillus sp. 54212 TaxID=3119829 RepID=UPI002FCB4872